MSNGCIVQCLLFVLFTSLCPAFSDDDIEFDFVSARQHNNKLWYSALCCCPSVWDKASNITWRYATPCWPIVDSKVNDLGSLVLMISACAQYLSDSCKQHLAVLLEVNPMYGSTVIIKIEYVFPIWNYAHISPILKSPRELWIRNCRTLLRMERADASCALTRWEHFLRGMMSWPLSWKCYVIPESPPANRCVFTRRAVLQNFNIPIRFETTKT